MTSQSLEIGNLLLRYHALMVGASSLSRTFLHFAASLMQRSETEINSCLDRLTDSQMLYRGGDHENSIANLLLHLEGNLRQWVLHGIAGQPNVRVRDEEFTLMPAMPNTEIRARFSATLKEAYTVIAAVPDARLLITIDPQPGGGWGSPTALEAIFHIVGHLQLHTGQIILLTKQLTRMDLDLSIPRRR